MQEGTLALINMTRFVLAINEIKKNNLPYIVVLTNPSTGGVLASIGMLGDVIFAEPMATAGFARRARYTADDWRIVARRFSKK